MKFKYYITNTFNGTIEGSNNKKYAMDAAACQEYFVLDVENDVWITDTGPQEIEEKP